MNWKWEMKTKDHKYRNPEARKLNEERAFRLKIHNPRRQPTVDKVSVRDATIMIEEEQHEDD